MKQKVTIVVKIMIALVFFSAIVKGQTSKTVVIEKLEVMKADLGFLTFNEAYFACKDLGNGWRLPTKSELNVIYENGIGGLRPKGSYWSSTESSLSLNKIWYQEFEFGMQSLDERGERHRARAVRTIHESKTKSDIISPSQYNRNNDPRFDIYIKLKKKALLPSKIKRRNG
jgi:hypothetical protein